jgi:arylsulfatase A-like enzyme
VPSDRPRNVIFILLDSLNREMLGAFQTTPGGTEFDTPNLDRFAKDAIRFTNHYSGSLPCMPARHDLLCGAWDFLWKPWGSIEIWEESLTEALRRSGVCTKLISDHPHLFESGGENYHVGFTAWTYERGHEGDPWRTRPDESWLGAPSFGRGWLPYDTSRGWFRTEEDFPGPKTMSAAARWLREEAPTVSGRVTLDDRFPQDAYRWDRFLLFVDEFDPHEPFDTPEPYASMYDERWEGPHLIWPPYTRGAKERGVLDDDQARQVRAQYGGKLTMIDRWLGRVLDAIDEGGYWDDTAVIVTTDHGHYLGEKDIWGKPPCPVFETMGHIPLMIRWPGAEPKTVDAMTTSVDLAATIVDIFGASYRHQTHGRSIVPLITGEVTSIRDWALCGVWGREVHLLWSGAGHFQTMKYARAPEGTNAPLSLWSNRWTTMPVWRFHDLRLPPPDDRAVLDKMPGSNVPVIRQPFREGDMLPYWAMGQFDGNHLYDVARDPEENENLAETQQEKVAADLLHDALKEVEAPSEQFVRLGLA